LITTFKRLLIDLHLTRLFSFNGRINRKVFIISFFSSFIIWWLFTLICLAPYSEYSDKDEIILIIFCTALPALWFLLAAGARRLHDLGYSGWLQIIYPVVLFLMIFKKGSNSDNEYGKTLIDEENNRQSLGNNMKTTVDSDKIPDVCPHCKNPNNRRTRLCEWCGSQII
jgi:uncharacterized membrane protein YhaH (DUF805 family)